MVKEGYDYQTETTAIRSRNACALTEELFDREEEKSVRILFSVLKTRSPRKSDWSQVFSDSSEGANYHTIDGALPKLVAQLREEDPGEPDLLLATL